MRYWTYISVIFSLLIVFYLHINEIFDLMDFQEKKELSAIFAQVSATMLGFILAALSVMATISGSRLIRAMADNGFFDVLLRRFFLNAFFYTLSMISAFVLMVFKGLAIQSFLFEIVFTLFSVSTLLLVDTGYRLWLVLTGLSDR